MRWHYTYRACQHYLTALSILLVLTIAGCGSSPTTVTGHVRYKGEVVRAGSVSFYGPDNQVANAVIKSDGSYTAANVPLGAVKVTVTTPPEMSEAMAKGLQKMKKGNFTAPPPQTIPVPLQYSKPDQSGVEFTVTKGSQNFDIDLK